MIRTRTVPPKKMEELVDELEKILADRGTAKDSEKLIADLIADVASSGGVALLDDLLTMGHSRAIIAVAIEPTAEDKRTRPWLRCAVLDGTAVVWPTTKAWSQVGQPNRRETPPGSRTVRHRTAPSRFAHWVEQIEPIAESRGILLTVDRGPGIRAVSEEMTQRAWALVRQGGSSANDAGILLTKPIPDALLVESWPDDPNVLAAREEKVYPHLGCDQPAGAEIAVASEFQFADCGSLLLSQRVRAHDVAMRLGGAWQAVVWVIDSQPVMTRLSRAGILDSARHPGHYIVEAQSVGLGDHPPLGVTNWAWPRVLPEV